MADQKVDTDNTSTTQVKHVARWPLWLALAVVVVLWVYTFHSFTSGIGDSLLEVGDRGTFGDMFGGLNALFSGFAFSGIIYTIYMQRKELEYQREELELTRKALQGQQAEMSEQNKTLKIQQFENTFFSMLRTFNDIIDAIDLHTTTAYPPTTNRQTHRTIVNKGRDCFKSFQRTLREDLSEFVSSIDLGQGLDLTYFDACYDKWWKKNRSNLAHYFRTLYNLLKFIDASTVQNKHIYTDIVRAQLSDQEQAILFYNCLSENGREKLKGLIERYALLKHVPDDLLLNSEHRNLYQTSAFRDDE